MTGSEREQDSGSKAKRLIKYFFILSILLLPSCSLFCHLIYMLKGELCLGVYPVKWNVLNKTILAWNSEILTPLGFCIYFIKPASPCIRRM